MSWDPTATVSPAQVTSLAAKSAVQRTLWFGATVSYVVAATSVSTDVQAVIATVVGQRELVDGGFELEHSALARIRTALVATATLGDRIVDASLGRSYRVAEVRRHKINPEWVLGLKQL